MSASEKPVFSNPGSLDKASIIYLQGQMHSLFLANSGDELGRLKILYPSVLQEAVQDSFLIVVGYSGACDPVFDALIGLTNFPRGLWWSHYGTSGESPGEGVDNLFLKQGSDCHLSSGDDADTFMKKLVLDGMKLDLPTEVLKPVTAIRRALERITPFPKDGMPMPDPVPDALEMLKRLEEQLAEPATDSASMGSRKLAVETQSASAGELAQILPIKMAALNGDWAEFHRLRKMLDPKPKTKVAREIGDGPVLQASELGESKPEEAFALLEVAEKLGTTPEMESWLPTIWGTALLDQAKRKCYTSQADKLFAQASLKFAEAVRIKPDTHEASINLACLTALQTKAAEAITHLEKWKAFHPAPRREKFDHHTDFDSIRDSPEFQAFRETLLEKRTGDG